MSGIKTSYRIIFTDGTEAECDALTYKQTETEHVFELSEIEERRMDKRKVKEVIPTSINPVAF